MMPIGRCRTRTWKRPKKYTKSMRQFLRAGRSDGAYDISSSRGCARRSGEPSLKNSKCEPLVQARLERTDVAHLTAETDVPVRAQQQQLIFVTCAVTRSERRARRDHLELEHGGEAVRETFQARLQHCLATFARGHRDQRAGRVPRQVEQRAAALEIDVGRAVADRRPTARRARLLRVGAIRVRDAGAPADDGLEKH